MTHVAVPAEVNLLSTKEDEEWMQRLQSNHGLTWYVTEEEQ
jgi:hypothetical protein